MTWTVDASYGTAQEKTSDTTLTVFGPARVLEVGDVIVVAVASDNVQTTDGTSTLISSVIGNNSGTFTKAYEYTNGEGAAAAGATCSVWYKRVGTEIPASADEIEVTWASAVTAKVISTFVFKATGASVSVASAQGAAHDTDPPSMTISGLSSKEYLFFRAVATERGNFGFGTSTNYTAISANTTNDPGDATDMAIGGEYRIFTGTGDTTDPETGVQSASVYIAFQDTNAYTMPAAQGTYALTGNATGLKFGHKLGAATGTFTLTGNAAGLAKGFKIAAAQGTFTLTGNSGEFRRFRLAADTATFALTGNSTGLIFGRRVQANTGSYNLVPFPAPLTKGRRFDAVTRTYTLTGNAATFRYGKGIKAEKGTFTLTGYEVKYKALLVADTRPYQLLGNAAGLKVARKLVAAVATFALTGNAATLTAPTGKRLFAEKAAYAISGVNVTLSTTGKVTPSRTSRGEALRYRPTSPPDGVTVDEALAWALQELEKASIVINNLAGGQTERLTVAPDKPRNGMIRMADGIKWNPGGGGEGYYAYKESTGAWVKLG